MGKWNANGHRYIASIFICEAFIDSVRQLVSIESGAVKADESSHRLLFDRARACARALTRLAERVRLGSIGVSEYSQFHRCSFPAVGRQAIDEVRAIMSELRQGWIDFYSEHRVAGILAMRPQFHPAVFYDYRIRDHVSRANVNELREIAGEVGHAKPQFTRSNPLLKMPLLCRLELAARMLRNKPNATNSEIERACGLGARYLSRKSRRAQLQSNAVELPDGAINEYGVLESHGSDD